MRDTFVEGQLRRQLDQQRAKLFAHTMHLLQKGL